MIQVSDSKARVITLDPVKNRTYHYWHVAVPGLKPGQLYGYRAMGPFEPQRGLRFDPDKVLLDPYARAVAVPQSYSRPAASQPGDSAAQAMKCVVTASGSYDWEGDAPLKRPFPRTVIYELHVGGFTRHPSSGVSPRNVAPLPGCRKRFPTFGTWELLPWNCCPSFNLRSRMPQPDCTITGDIRRSPFLPPTRDTDFRRTPWMCWTSSGI